MSHHPHDLLAALGLAPALPGARCRGRAHLFDEATTEETQDVVTQRHSQALGLCRLCPSLASCQQWFDGLKPSQRPPGVVAGKVNTQKPGRPRRSA